MRFLFFLSPPPPTVRLSFTREGEENKFNQRLTMLGEYTWRHQRSYDVSDG